MMSFDSMLENTWKIFALDKRSKYTDYKKKISLLNEIHFKDNKCPIVPVNPLIQFITKLSPDGKVHGANMGPTWVLSAPDGPHVGPIYLGIKVWLGGGPSLQGTVQRELQTGHSQMTILPGMRPIRAKHLISHEIDPAEDMFVLLTWGGSLYTPKLCYHISARALGCTPGYQYHTCIFRSYGQKHIFLK